jgi:hypothetical protein
VVFTGFGCLRVPIGSNNRTRLPYPFRRGIGSRQRSLGLSLDSTLPLLIDPAISIWEQLCSIQGSSQPLTRMLLRSICPLQDSSSACLTAMKPQPFWASTKKLCNEWHAAEKSPASKLGIFGVSVRRHSTSGSLQGSRGNRKTTPRLRP